MPTIKNIWKKLSDRKKAPRKWWHPEISVEPGHKDVVAELHKEYSNTINKTMLSMLGVGLYCLLTVIGSPDRSLIAPVSTITAPIIGSSISFTGFLFVAPGLLIGLIIYLHILLHYFEKIERERLQLNQNINSGEPHIKAVPAIFNFDDKLSRFLSSITFYWFVPLVLWVISWKAFARTELIRPLLLVSLTVTSALIFLKIRRAQDDNRLKINAFRWSVLVGLCAFSAYVITNNNYLHRPMDLKREDLRKAWLVGVDLHDANFENANLEGAYLMRANLQRTHIIESNLQGAHLQGADLQGAHLQGTNLQGALIQWANLQDAHLQGTHLQGANLQGALIQWADLQGADLQKTYLVGAHLQWANLQWTHLQGANLQGADLQGANLKEADLQGANLLRAHLLRAHLLKAHLNGALLKETYLKGADLQGADLRGADLKGADLKGADNWNKALYSPEIINDLGLPNDHNKKLELLTEDESSPGN
jgi:uncharacterized protein YjbI with pentapeptide repeats